MTRKDSNCNPLFLPQLHPWTNNTHTKKARKSQRSRDDRLVFTGVDLLWSPKLHRLCTLLPPVRHDAGSPADDRHRDDDVFLEPDGVVEKTAEEIGVGPDSPAG